PVAAEVQRLRRLEVVDAHQPALAGDRQAVAVGAVGDAAQGAAGHGEVLDELAGWGLPEPHPLRPPVGPGQGLAVGAEGPAAALEVAPLRGVALLAGRRVPGLRRAVEAVGPRGDEPAVGAEGDAGNRLGVPGEREPRFAAVGVPEADGGILAAGGD